MSYTPTLSSKRVYTISSTWGPKLSNNNHVLTSIHLAYVRIPGKGITLHRLLQGDDDNSEIGIGNVLSENNHGWFYEILNGG
jgi:hypothetical protein